MTCTRKSTTGPGGRYGRTFRARCALGVVPDDRATAIPPPYALGTRDLVLRVVRSLSVRSAPDRITARSHPVLGIVWIRLIRYSKMNHFGSNENRFPHF